MKSLWLSNRTERLARLEERAQLVEHQSSARNWDKELEMADYFVVDIETSGFEAADDIVLALAASRMSGPALDVEIDQYDLVRHDSLHQVPDQIWTLTGLSPEAVREGRDWRDVLLQALSLSANRVWIAHHARHELSFLQRHARLFWKMKLHPLVIDTAVVARILYRLPSVPTLEDACHRLEVPIRRRHRADEDVLMTAALWKKELQLCRSIGLQTVGDVIEWSMSYAE